MLSNLAPYKGMFTCYDSSGRFQVLPNVTDECCQMTLTAYFSKYSFIKAELARLIAACKRTNSFWTRPSLVILERLTVLYFHIFGSVHAMKTEIPPFDLTDIKDQLIPHDSYSHYQHCSDLWAFESQTRSYTIKLHNCLNKNID